MMNVNERDEILTLQTGNASWYNPALRFSLIRAPWDNLYMTLPCIRVVTRSGCENVLEPAA